MNEVVFLLILSVSGWVSCFLFFVLYRETAKENGLLREIGKWHLKVIAYERVTKDRHLNDFIKGLNDQWAVLNEWEVQARKEK
jgi:hypothetical protein